jgi:hypothetical protein
MKQLNIVYFRTMVDSPEVSIECVTTSKFIAERALLKAKREEEEWMADEDEDSGNWAEACIRTFEIPNDIKEGDTIHLVVETSWDEEVATGIYPFVRKEDAVSLLKYAKQDWLEKCPGLVPFDEDETFDEAMVLEDEDEQVTIFFDIVDAKVQ